MIAPPLVVDLDGTLIHADMLHESALRVLKDRPLQTLRIPFLLAGGKALLKQHLAAHTDFDPGTLPYNEELLAWLRGQRARGRRLILCTAADRAIAHAIAAHLALFDEVIASDGVLNLSGRHKAERLVQRFDRAGFDYAGNCGKDLPVWSCARHSIVVNGSRRLARRAGEISTLERVFPQQVRGFKDWLQVLRIHLWIKNLLLFVPLFAAHELNNREAWSLLIPAFLSFSLCASAVYITNDLLDLESDRRHPRKRTRPFACGRVPLWMGAGLAPVLLLGSAAIAVRVGEPFLVWLALYFALSCAYTWLLKRWMLVDCLTLALLHTLRIIAGAATLGHRPSGWLLACSLCLFLSLAFVKRYAELQPGCGTANERIHGRGYHRADAPLIRTLGIVTAGLAVLVLALYIDSDAVVRLYHAPAAIWGAVPVMLAWTGWMWRQAHLGRMHDDPLVFAVRDPVSQTAAVALGTVLIVATLGL